MKRRFYLIPAAALLLTASCGNQSADGDSAASDTIEIETALSVDSAFNTPHDTTAADTPAVAEETPEETPSLPEGVVAQCDTRQFGKITFKKGGRFTFRGGSGSWKRVGKAYSFQIPEMTIEHFILDGRLYEGTYNASANTRTYEYQTPDNDLDMKTEKVKPADGTPVSNFEEAR